MKKKLILNYYNETVYEPSKQFLYKDFGQVACVLGEKYRLPVQFLISCKSRNEKFNEFDGHPVIQMKKKFSFLPTKLDFLKNIKTYFHLFTKRGEYSHLVFFPFTPPSDYVFLKLFKFFNPLAKTIIKLDANERQIRAYQLDHANSKFCYFKQYFYYSKLLFLVDVVIYETEKVGHLLSQERFLGVPVAHKAIQVKNGLSLKNIEEYSIGKISVNEKSNLLIFSGRLWSSQKNVEMLFENDPIPKGWKVVLIGPYGNKKLELLKKYESTIDDFKEKYLFIGEITDKLKYYDIMQRGKILVLTSLYEGYPNVYGEAILSKLYIVTSDVSGADDATCDGLHGVKFPVGDNEGFKDIIARVCYDEALNERIELSYSVGFNSYIWNYSLNDKRISTLFTCNNA